MNSRTSSITGFRDMLKTQITLFHATQTLETVESTAFTVGRQRPIKKVPEL